MKFDIMTLFPDLVTTVLSESIIGRAQKNGIIEVAAHNIRDFSEKKTRRVDDTPYGGGMGMLMECEPIYQCFRSVIDSAPTEEKRRTVYLSPKGALFTQKTAKRLSEYDRLIFLCGHYEGVDDRGRGDIYRRLCIDRGRDPRLHRGRCGVTAFAGRAFFARMLREREHRLGAS